VVRNVIGRGGSGGYTRAAAKREGEWKMRLACCVCLLTLLGIAGCAPAVTNTAGPAAATARSVPSSEGTILSMRPVRVRGDRVPWRAALLADASSATTAGDDGNSDLTEFIVRTDAGSTISVVQANELGFRPGDRVTILHDGHTHIARPG
jgi:outer membrane lipoprotein SlyB